MDGFRLRWSKKENDWLFEYNDRAGKSLMSLFFDMLKIEKNIDWLKRKWVSNKTVVAGNEIGGFVDIPENERDTLIKQLTDRGFDYKTLIITCKKIKKTLKFYQFKLFITFVFTHLYYYKYDFTNRKKNKASLQK